MRSYKIDNVDGKTIWIDVTEALPYAEGQYVATLKSKIDESRRTIVMLAYKNGNWVMDNHKDWDISHFLVPDIPGRSPCFIPISETKDSVIK